MRDEDKTKEKLISELVDLRKQISTLKTSNTGAQIVEAETLKQQMEFILGITKTGIDIIDSEFNIRYIDPEWKKVYGDPTDKKCYQYFMGRNGVCPGCGIIKALETKTIAVTEEVLVKENNRPIQVTTIPFQDDKGEWVVAEVNVDITERKKIEKELQTYRDHLEELVNERTIELSDTKNYLDNIIESSVDCIVVSDSTGYITRANKSFLSLMGYKEEEITGKQIQELSPIEEGRYESITGETINIDSEFFKDAKTRIYSILFEKGKISNWETYLISKDKKVIPVEESIVFLYNKEGDVSGAVGIIRDITERRKSERETKEAKEFLENVFKTSVDGIMVTDNEGIMIMVNEAITKMLGYSKNELIGKRTGVFNPKGESYKKNVHKYLTILCEEGTVTSFELTYLKKDRNLIDVEVNSALLRDNKGNITGAVTSIRDITERKKFEDALKRSEEKYQNLIENANDAVISINKDGIIVTLNKKAEEMYGYAREELLGNSVLLLVSPHRREDQKKTLEKLKTITKVEGFKRTLETIAFGKDGKEFPVETSMFDSEIHGEYILTSFIRDISARKKMEQKLLQSEKLKSLGELSGGVAHDFNNVLAAILGRVQLLKMQLNSPVGKEEKRKSVFELKKGLEIIEKASLDGAETVRRIQEFSRRRTDDRDFTRVGINELLDNALEFTRVRWKNQAESKGIKVNIKKELSPLTPTLGSSSEIREVFTNLINNAIDAMPQGGEIRVESFMDDTIAVIRISDTGKGIPKNIKDRVFDPFFTTKGPQFTGLGLSVSYGIINRHHGTITVDSVEGEGTTFIVRFPITKEIDQGNVKDEKVISIKKKQKKARILVIEDEEDVRQLLKDILTNAGHEVEVAKNGSEGITLFKEKEFDLVFTDLGMPVMSGWEVAKKVKSFKGEVPVALITGWNVELESSEMNDSGINLVIYKPFKMEQVLNSVQEGMLLRDQLKAV